MFLISAYNTTFSLHSVDHMQNIGMENSIESLTFTFVTACLKKILGSIKIDVFGGCSSKVSLKT